MQRKRYKRQDAPDFRFLKLDLRDAQPTMRERAADPIGTEARRVKAVARLIELARAPSFDGADPALLLQLRRFLEIRGHRILTSDDPATALQDFFGRGARSRGRPTEDLADRDLAIAADVAQLHASGLSLNAAYQAVSERPGAPSVKRVESIYGALKGDDAVLAVIEQTRALAPPSQSKSSDGKQPG